MPQGNHPAAHPSSICKWGVQKAQWGGKKAVRKGDSLETEEIWKASGDRLGKKVKLLSKATAETYDRSMHHGKKIATDSWVVRGKQNTLICCWRTQRKGRKKKTQTVYDRTEIFKMIFQISQKGRWQKCIVLHIQCIHKVIISFLKIK